jgi:uncharacterized protein YjbJ (UPF0337 family)
MPTGARPRSVLDRIVGTAKRMTGAVLGDLRLEDEGRAQQRRARFVATRPRRPVGH